MRFCYKSTIQFNIMIMLTDCRLPYKQKNSIMKKLERFLNNK